MSGRRWTPAEVDALELHYGTLTVERIAKLLGRTTGSVYNQATKMRLGRRMPPGSLTGNVLMQALGIGDTNLVRSWFRMGLIKARRMPGYGRADRPVWCVMEADLVTFLTEHPEMVDRDKVERAYRQFVPVGYITLVEAFRRGAAFPNLLENAVKAGLIPEARQRGQKGTRWAIPETILADLVAARRRMTSDTEHHRLRAAYDRQQAKGSVARRKSWLNAKGRAAARGGRSGTVAA